MQLLRGLTASTSLADTGVYATRLLLQENVITVAAYTSRVLAMGPGQAHAVETSTDSSFLLISRPRP